MSHDPTIPRKKSNAASKRDVRGATWGWFVDYGAEGLILTDSRGNTWPQASVRMLTGSFGFNVEGMHAAPRARVYAGDTVVVDGDCFLIDFLDNDPKKPILLGGIRTTKPQDPDFFPVPVIGEDPNPKRIRMALMDANGVVTGHVQATALDGGTNLEIVVGGASFGTGLRLKFDYVAGTIAIGAGQELFGVPLGDVYADTIAKLAADIVAVNIAIPTFVSAAIVDTPQIALDAAASLASGGAPLLSDTVKVQ